MESSSEGTSADSIDIIQTSSLSAFLVDPHSDTREDTSNVNKPDKLKGASDAPSQSSSPAIRLSSSSCSNTSSDGLRQYSTSPRTAYTSDSSCQSSSPAIKLSNSSCSEISTDSDNISFSPTSSLKVESLEDDNPSLETKFQPLDCDIFETSTSLSVLASGHCQGQSSAKIPSLPVEQNYVEHPLIPVQVSYQLGKVLSYHNVDLEKLTRLFYSCELISEEDFEKIHQSPCKDVWNLLDSLLNHISTVKLIFVLNENGQYQGVVHDFVSFYTKFTKSSPILIKRHSVGNRRNIQLYFKDIKKSIHERRTGSKNPHADVKIIGDNLLAEFKREQNPRKRQWLCDKYICLKAAEIDALTNQTDDINPDGEDFQEMKTMCSESSCPEISYVLMLGRQADIASSISNKTGDGEGYLTFAFQWQSLCERCIESTDMIYKSVVFNLLQFELTNDILYQKKLFTQAHTGLDSLSDEQDVDVRSFWKRLFHLRIMFGHLGIGKRCRIMSKYIVPQNSVDTVQKMFKKDEFKKDNLEHRRKMMFGVARTRLFELTDDIENAKLEIDEVVDIACEGNYTEKENVLEYQSFIHDLFTRTLREKQNVITVRSVTNTSETEKANVATVTPNTSQIRHPLSIEYSGALFSVENISVGKCPSLNKDSLEQCSMQEKKTDKSRDDHEQICGRNLSALDESVNMNNSIYQPNSIPFENGECYYEHYDTGSELEGISLNSSQQMSSLSRETNNPTGKTEMTFKINHLNESQYNYIKNTQELDSNSLELKSDVPDLQTSF